MLAMFAVFISGFGMFAYFIIAVYSLGTYTPGVVTAIITIRGGNFRGASPLVGFFRCVHDDRGVDFTALCFFALSLWGQWVLFSMDFCSRIRAPYVDFGGRLEIPAGYVSLRGMNFVLRV